MYFTMYRAKWTRSAYFLWTEEVIRMRIGEVAKLTPEEFRPSTIIPKITWLFKSLFLVHGLLRKECISQTHNLFHHLYSPSFDRHLKIVETKALTLIPFVRPSGILLWIWNHRHPSPSVITDTFPKVLDWLLLEWSISLQLPCSHFQLSHPWFWLLTVSIHEFLFLGCHPNTINCDTVVLRIWVFPISVLTFVAPLSPQTLNQSTVYFVSIDHPNWPYS